jgi:hypothetical protein
MNQEMLTNRSKIIKNFITDAPAVSCSSCGIPGHAVKLMKGPSLTGYYCSILCAEQAIYEAGCAWCGASLDGNGNQRFCSESCRAKAAASKFGDASV